MSTLSDNKNKLRNILTEMFQFDQADLDFGIYRIMNQKRDQVNRFMNNELFNKIEKEINSLEKISNDIDIKKIEEDIYYYLTDFFSRYYDEGDFISQRRYKDGSYAIPYQGEEVKLYWSNFDQYYVKSSENFTDYIFYDGSNNKIHFKLIDAKVTKDNNKEKENRTFQIIENIEAFNEFLEEDDKLESNPKIVNDTLIIYFNYSNDKSTQKKRNDESYEYIKKWVNQNNLVKYSKLIDKTKKADKSEFEIQINKYTAKNTFDYFIHKDLNKFLTRELDFYIKSEIIHLEDLDLGDFSKLQQSILKAKIVENISKTIISFLSQIEEFQKSLWLKKKFVVDTNYCITIDKIDKKFYEDIIKNKKQIEEWENLFSISELTKEINEEFLINNPFLVLDTKFFEKNLKEEIIGSIDNIDDETNGLLINSDNFQALNLLQEKYREKIDCVYIDPPYNSPQSVIMYKNNFKHSSWLTLIDNRMSISKTLLKKSSIYNIAIDDYELINLCEYIDSNYPEYDRNIVVVNHHPQGTPKNNISRTHEYSVILTPKGKNVIKGEVSEEIEERSLMRSGTAENNFRYGRKNSFYAYLVDPTNGNVVGYEESPELDEEYPLEKTSEGYIRIYPIGKDGTERVWRISSKSDTLKNNNISDIVICKNNTTLYQIVKNKKAPVNSLWSEKVFNAGTYGSNLISDYMGDSSYFSYPKSLYTVKKHLNLETEENSIILDYFAGSGTTAHATIDLNRDDNGNRKYILVEMGEYFNTVTKPRTEKVIYSKDWKNGKPVDREGISHIFKYITLESYEDSLNNIEFIGDNMFALLPDGSLAQKDYMLSYMLQMETKDSKCLLNIDSLKNPFDYSMKILENNEIKTKNIDIIETFNYLVGIKILRNHSIQSYDADFYTEEYGREKAKIHIGEKYKFKIIEGILPDDRRALIIWRNVSKNIKKDNIVLNSFLERKRINSTDFEYDVIYVNCDNFIKNISLGNNLKVKLIEDEMKKMMFEGGN